MAAFGPEVNPSVGDRLRKSAVQLSLPTRFGKTVTVCPDSSRSSSLPSSKSQAAVKARR